MPWACAARTAWMMTTLSVVWVMTSSFARDVLHANNDSGSNMPSGDEEVAVSEGAGSGGILAAGEGEGVLQGDDGSDTLHRDVGSNMPSIGGSPRCAHHRR
jgi:hypothetical protein